MNFLFAAFDVFPSPKGAATHIALSIRSLEQIYGSAALLCLGTISHPRHQRENNIFISRCRAHHPNFLKRTEYFSAFVQKTLDRSPRSPSLVHFRDIWSGVPLVAHAKCQGAKKVFEVNGLPSIELPLHYPALLYQNRRFVDQLRQTESYLLEKADAVLTVSRVNAEHLHSRGVPREKIAVIPNAASIPDTVEPKESEEPPFALYAGTLAPWQGVSTLIAAWSLICNKVSGRLVIVGSTKKHWRVIRKQIQKHNIANRVDVHFALNRQQLNQLYRAASFSVAPLARCDRNEIQGCSPLKILESMAAGTPVIASNLPVCRELMTHRRDGLLIKPDSPRALANGMVELFSNPETRRRFGQAAISNVKKNFSPDVFLGKLLSFYNSIIPVNPRDTAQRQQEV